MTHALLVRVLYLCPYNHRTDVALPWRSTVAQLH